MNSLNKLPTALTNRIDKVENRNNELELKLDEMQTKLSVIEKENDDLKESLLFTQEELIEKKMFFLREETNTEIRKLYGNCAFLREKNRKLDEDRSRRSNIRIDGLEEENQYETWEETEEKVLNLFKEKLGITEKIEIERAHRMERRNTEEDKNKKARPRTVILKLLHSKDKENILKNVRAE